MKPKEPVNTNQFDLLRLRLDQIVNMKHDLVVLADKIDWEFICNSCDENYADQGRGHPALSIRLMAGLHIIKYMDDLSDDEVCRRWLENPYYQYFCGEEFFCHDLPCDRSSMTRWRQRMGEEKIAKLLQESLSLAVRLGAAKPTDFTQVTVDTTVAEKNIAYPTDAKLMHKARERLVKLAKKHGINLRQTYVRVGKTSLIMQQRYAHAKQYKRARRQLKKLKTYLGRTIRDMRRQIKGNAVLEEGLKRELWMAERVMSQKPRDDIPKKFYSLHAPEVECIGKGKAHKPYEFGVKTSIATTINRSKGGQFAVHAKALPGKPYDGHTLKDILPEIELFTGAALKRILADKGYRGHNALKKYKLKILISGQKRGVTPYLKNLMKRRSAVEPVIGHIKSEHRMKRNYLAHTQGDAINPVLAAAGYNFRLIRAWIKLLFVKSYILIFIITNTKLA